MQAHTHDYTTAASSHAKPSYSSSRQRYGNLGVAFTEPPNRGPPAPAMNRGPPGMSDSPSHSRSDKHFSMPPSKSPSRDPARASGWSHREVAPHLHDAQHRALFALQSPMSRPAASPRFDFNRSLSADDLDSRPLLTDVPEPTDMGSTKSISTTRPRAANERGVKLSSSQSTDVRDHSRSSSPSGFSMPPKPGSWPKSGSTSSLLEPSRKNRSPFNRPKSNPPQDHHSQSPPRKHALTRNRSHPNASFGRSPSPMLDLSLPINTAIPPIRPSSVDSASPIQSSSRRDLEAACSGLTLSPSAGRERHLSASEAEASQRSPTQSRHHRRVQSSSSDRSGYGSSTNNSAADTNSGAGAVGGTVARRKGLFPSSRRRRALNNGGSSTSPMPIPAGSHKGAHGISSLPAPLRSEAKNDDSTRNSSPLVLSEVASSAVLGGNGQSPLKSRAAISSKKASELLRPTFSGPLPSTKQKRVNSASSPSGKQTELQPGRASDSAVLMRRRGPMYLSDAVANRAIADGDTDDVVARLQRGTLPKGV